MSKRESKDSYYLNIAEAVLARSTCLRRKYGAVIVKDDEIISTGYNGSPRGASNCIDLGYCYRQQQRVPHGENYELCRSVHGEANAIISASQRDMIGATLYFADKFRIVDFGAWFCGFAWVESAEELYTCYNTYKRF